MKIPTACEALTNLRPVQLAGGEQSLFAITSEGRVYATGKFHFLFEFENLKNMFRLFVINFQ